MAADFERHAPVVTDGWVSSGAEEVLAHPERSRVRPSLCEEVAELASEGFDVQFTFTADPYEQSEERQRLARMIIDNLEQAQMQPAVEGGPSGHDLLRDPRLFPAVGAWSELIMHAMALHPLYGAGRYKTLGEDIRDDALDRPIFDAHNTSSNHPEALAAPVSARQLLAAETDPAKANRRVARHERFRATPIDAGTRLLFECSLDGRAIRTRAGAFVGLALEHVADSSGRITRQDIRIASLGCGAAGPLCELVQSIRAHGGDIERATLVDQDPIALASALSLAETRGIGDVVEVQRRNLVEGSPSSYIEEPVDIVDLLGVFEYFPNDEKYGPMAVQLLQRAASIVKPGGLIVFGNMVPDRDEQLLFQDVIHWPRVQQRSIREMIAIVEAAGFDPRDLIVRVPAGEGVYAVYALRVPTEEERRARGPAHTLDLLPAA